MALFLQLIDAFRLIPSFGPIPKTLRRQVCHHTPPYSPAAGLFGVVAAGFKCARPVPARPQQQKFVLAVKRPAGLLFFRRRQSSAPAWRPALKGNEACSRPPRVGAKVERDQQRGGIFPCRIPDKSLSQSPLSPMLREHPVKHTAGQKAELQLAFSPFFSLLPVAKISSTPSASTPAAPKKAQVFVSIQAARNTPLPAPGRRPKRACVRLGEKLRVHSRINRRNTAIS